MTSEASPDAHHRRSDIQGLRAVAVLGVIVFHAFQAALPGGFVGVDVFFVLSGFLITGILVRSMEARRFSILEFYRRRVSRLFPALFVMLAFTLAVGFVILAPQTYKELSLTQFFTTLFVSNLAFIRISGYFDADATLRPLLHTWSLGVEEQFYLLFPPVLWLLHRFTRPLLWPAIAVLAAVSLWQAQTILGVNPTKAFYHPYGRAVELLVGSLAYGLSTRWRPGRVGRQILSWGGAAAVVGAMVLLNDRTPFPGVWAMPACLGTAALLLSQGGMVNRALGARPLVVVGDMSYSLYLWHWPLLVYGHLAFGRSGPATAAAVILAFVAAWLSRRYVEAPFLDGSRRPVWWMALGAMTASILACCAVYFTDGLPQRFNARERAVFAGVEDHNPDRKRCHKRSSGDLPYADTCIYGDKSRPPVAAVWADSLGAELGKVYGEALGERGLSARSITASGCGAGTGRSEDRCDAHNRQILAGLIAEPSMRTVVLTAYFPTRREHASGSPLPGMLDAARALKRAGKQVILIEPIPHFDFEPPSEAGLALRFGRDPREVGAPSALYDGDYGADIARMRAFGAAEGVPVVATRDLFCDARLCRVYDPESGVLFYDSAHPTLTGARRVAARLLPLSPGA